LPVVNKAKGDVHSGTCGSLLICFGGTKSVLVHQFVIFPRTKIKEALLFLRVVPNYLLSNLCAMNRPKGGADSGVCGSLLICFDGTKIVLINNLRYFRLKFSKKRFCFAELHQTTFSVTSVP